MTMVPDQTLVENYKYIEKLLKSNTADSFTIEYNKLDDESQAKLRRVITETLLGRKQILGHYIFKAQT